MPADSATILVVDDESSILETIRILFKNDGFSAHTALGGKAGIEEMRRIRPDVVITDVRMPGITGLDVLTAARSLDPDMPVILMTAQATIQSAMQAVNDGAYYYIQKPFRNDELLGIARRATEHRQLRVENRTLKQEMKRRDRGGRPLGNNRAWTDLLHVAETVAPTESTVLLHGESGTGKEVVARYIHDLSSRAGGPYVSLNCGALPEALLESELFGHTRGAFSGAVTDRVGLFSAAVGGTFFLDEIGETTPATQVKLLRALQTGEIIPVGATESVPVDARVIAATNRDLDQEIARGTFRSDLFYRLNVISLHLPPLRHRADDIPVLMEAFLSRAADARGEDPKRVDDEATELMLSYSWPGNVRELENAIERAVILATGPRITSAVLPERIRQRRTEPLVGKRSAANPSLETIERAYISWVLNAEGGNKTRAAETLGIDPSTLYRKLARFGETHD